MADDPIAGQIGNVVAILSGQTPTYRPPAPTPPASSSSSTGGGGGGGGGGATGSGSFDDAFYSQILSGVGAPVTEDNLRFMRAWNQAEGMPGSTYNPFATTQDASGASNWNSVGVRIYPDASSGVNATVQTLLNGYYGGILDALRSGNNAVGAAQALANSPWGTGGLVLSILGGG